MDTQHCVMPIPFLLLLSTVYASPNYDLLTKDTVIAIALVSNIICEVCSYMDNSRKERGWVPRKRRCVKDIFQELGPYHVRRSYCMNESTFWKLNSILLPYIPNLSTRKRKRDNNPNGDIHSSQKLFMSIRYFVGSPSNLMPSQIQSHPRKYLMNLDILSIDLRPKPMVLTTTNNLN